MAFAYTLKEIAKYINAELRGQQDVEINNIASLSEASNGDLSFIIDQKYLNILKTCQAEAIICSSNILANWQGNALITENPYLAYAKAAELFAKKSDIKPTIHQTTIIADSCEIAKNVSIAANVVIGEHVKIADGCIIGANTIIGNYCTLSQNCELKANVTLCDDVSLGSHCIIHSGTIIGCDGFGNAKDGEKWHKIPQLGSVKIANDVEIGANCTIDCGALGDTIIEQGVHLDNLIQIAHNVKIGAYTAIAAQTGIAGSTEIGKHCMIGGQVGISGHITICDNVILTAKSMVIGSINESGVYSSGTGLSKNNIWKKNMARLRNLDFLAKKINKIDKQINEGETV